MKTHCCCLNGAYSLLSPPDQPLLSSCQAPTVPHRKLPKEVVSPWKTQTYKLEKRLCIEKWEEIEVLMSMFFVLLVCSSFCRGFSRPSPCRLHKFTKPTLQTRREKALRKNYDNFENIDVKIKIIKKSIARRPKKWSIK